LQIHDPLDFDSVKADMTLFFNVFFVVEVDIIKNKLNQAIIIAIYNKRKKHISHLIAIYIKN